MNREIINSIISEHTGYDDIDYYNDFNALYLACEKISPDQKIEMIDILCEIVKKDLDITNGPYSCMTAAFYASSGQRAEALARLITDLKR